MSDTTHHRRRKASAGGSASLPRRVDEPAARREPFTGSKLSPRFLDDTIAFWQPRAKRPLNREDAREIVQNLTGFFGVLREWREAERLAAKRRAPARNEQNDTSRTRKSVHSAKGADP